MASGAARRERPASYRGRPRRTRRASLCPPGLPRPGLRRREPLHRTPRRTERGPAGRARLALPAIHLQACTMNTNNPLPAWTLRGRTLLPVVQGGMGVGVSAHRLAGHVARLGAMGTISSVDLRQHHPDLLERSAGIRDKAQLDALNHIALDREVRAALALADGHGVVAVNVMKAVNDHAAHVRQACESGIQAIVMGAGLPLDLPELAAGYPDVALVPILSEARGVSIVVRKWMRKGRLPDAIVIEHPGFAGGHLGATRLAEVRDPRFDAPHVLEEVLALFDSLGLGRREIPIIVAGGIHTHEQVRHALALGAAAVQVGTAFAVTEEGD